MDRRKIDKAITFVENNRCMMESLRSQEDDQDVVPYIINILKRHKKETPGAATPRAIKVTRKSFTPLL